MKSNGLQKKEQKSTEKKSKCVHTRRARVYRQEEPGSTYMKCKGLQTSRVIIYHKKSRGIDRRRKNVLHTR